MRARYGGQPPPSDGSCRQVARMQTEFRDYWPSDKWRVCRPNAEITGHPLRTVGTGRGPAKLGASRLCVTLLATLLTRTTPTQTVLCADCSNHVPTALQPDVWLPQLYRGLFWEKIVFLWWGKILVIAKLWGLVTLQKVSWQWRTITALSNLNTHHRYVCLPTIMLISVLCFHDKEQHW